MILNFLFYFDLAKKKEANAPDFAKYEGMKKMGMPMHAIENKMRLDGMTKEQIEQFKNRMFFCGGFGSNNESFDCFSFVIVDVIDSASEERRQTRFYKI